MKITPINFTTFLQPELSAYWEEHRFASGKKVEIRRTHNLSLVESTMNAVAVDREGQAKLLSSIQLVQIPQQENHPALKALIHLPHQSQPKQLLMVFKQDSDTQKWANHIVEKLQVLMLGATDPDEEKASAEAAADVATDAEPEATAEPDA